MDYFRVRNFEKYQPKRKTKHAPWVCLYVNWTNAWAVGQLHDSYKAHWIGLICVAHTTNNQIPYDAVWIKKRCGFSSPVKIELFEKLGLIEKLDAKTKKHANEKVYENIIEYKRIKEKEYDSKLIELFDKDWEELPRKEGNRKKAMDCWMTTVGFNLSKAHPKFKKQLQDFKKSVEGREKKYIKTGEVFMRNWESLVFDTSPNIKPSKTGGAIL